MFNDKGTNEYYGDEDEKDDYEPDVDAINDAEWLRKKEEEEEDEMDYKEAVEATEDDVEDYVCCKGDCK
jgi:hypothetical protein